MKKLIVLIIVFIGFFGSVLALEITTTGKDIGGSYEDRYKFSTSANSEIYIALIDNLSLAYNTGKRIMLIQRYNIESTVADTYATMGTGILVSELYGDFYIENNSISFINDSTINSNCVNVSYTIIGTLISPAFGHLEIQPESYYCPLSGDNSITLKSDLLGNITITGSTVEETLVIENSRGELQDISSFNVFDNKKISINGLTSINNISGLQSDYSDIKNINTKVEIEGKMANFNKIIGKNLAKHTRLLDPITELNVLNRTLEGFSKQIHYYDLEAKEEATSSNEGNEGKILRIGKYTDSGNNEDYYKMQVVGQKLLYIKGGNLYIDADIYNKNKESQLVIIVKRDSTNRKNGGNIYIDPEVTNIDATIIADGSIISYNGTETLNTDTDVNSLRKQLLIYGSLSTKNTFGEDKDVYGTDSYIKNGGKPKEGVTLYNLAKLRSFQINFNNEVIGSCSGSDEIIARGNTSTTVTRYAFAGKKKCFISDFTQDFLRGTEKTTPLVIEYNPIIQTNPHFILESN